MYTTPCVTPQQAHLYWMSERIYTRNETPGGGLGIHSYKMFKLNVIILLLPALALASLVPRDNRIPALLRYGTRVGASRALGLEARQSDCAFAGTFHCPDGFGCCITGTYCSDDGCCPNGETCIPGSGKCPLANGVECPESNTCCPAGDTCLNDSAGRPKCSPPSGGGSGAGPATTSTVRATLTKTITTPFTTARTTMATSITTAGSPSFSSGGSGGVSGAAGCVSVVVVIIIATSFFAL
ncbi:hypothetical protein BD779DRAFT_1003338 [Infundibulicybe gibba]|nr:hypothetical protein BD779DRAFT_1003338 [Infundibulicybe gibba]